MAEGERRTLRTAIGCIAVGEVWRFTCAVGRVTFYEMCIRVTEEEGDIQDFADSLRGKKDSAVTRRDGEEGPDRVGTTVV